MSNTNPERTNAANKNQADPGFFGSRTFYEVQRTMNTLPRQRLRMLYGAAVVLSGAEHLRRAISTGSTTEGVSSRDEVARGVKEIAIGAERIVDALFTGVAERVERGLNEIVGPLRDEMREAREMRARQIQEQDS